MCCCLTDAAQDKTKHVLKFFKLFTHVVGCKYFRKRMECEQDLKLSSFWQLSQSTVPNVPYLYLRRFVTCHISAMHCITHAHDSERCIKWIVKVVSCPCCGSFSTQLLTLWGIVSQPKLGFISLWNCNFILYTVLKLWVVESKQKFSFIGMMPAQPFIHKRFP